MKRKIIKIDENKCNGCGNCIPDCPEGALKMIDGKARLLSDLFCDGLGACMGACPVGAISVQEREAEPYNEKKVMENIVKAGENTIKAHLKHLDEHGETSYLEQAIEYLKEQNIEVPVYKEESKCMSGGCPGSRIIDMREPASEDSSAGESVTLSSKLRQWPVQLALVNPHAPYFNDADLLITADCVPFANANFHNEFLKGKALVIFCPKLDIDIDRYIDKLSIIIRDNNIKSLTAVRMQVPCCGGTTMVLNEALKKSGKNIDVEEYVISLQGEVL
jgi:ferredoxin